MDENQSASLSPALETPPPPTAAAEEGEREELFSSKSIVKDTSSGGGGRIGSGGGGLISDFDTEDEEYMSGDDEFETASERPSVADPEEENLELVMEEEGKGSIVGEKDLGSSKVPILTEESIILGGETNVGVVGSEVGADGIAGIGEVEMGVEEVPEVRILGGEGGESGGSSIVSGSIGDDAEKMIEEDGVVRKSENGVLGSEMKGIEVEQNQKLDTGLIEGKVAGVIDNPIKALAEKMKVILGRRSKENEVVEEDLDSAEKDVEVLTEKRKDDLAENSELKEVVKPVIKDKIPEVTEDSIKTLVDSKEDTIPEILESNEVVKPVVGSQEVTELKDRVAEEVKSEILTVDPIELVREVPGVTGIVEDASAKEEEILPENLKSNEVKPYIGGQEEETTEVKDVIVAEKSVDFGGDVKVAVATGGSSVVDTKQNAEAPENGVSAVDGAVLASGNMEAGIVIEEPTDSKFVEADREANSRKEEASLVGTEQLTIHELKDDDAPEIHEKVTSETEVLELAPDKSETASILWDQVPAAVKEPEQPKVAEADVDTAKVDEPSDFRHGTAEKSLEPMTSSAIETREREHQELKGEVEKDYDVQQIDLEAKPSDSELKLVADGEPNTVHEDKDVIVKDSINDSVAAEHDASGEVISSVSDATEPPVPKSILDSEAKEEAQNEHYEDEGSLSDDDNDNLIFEGSEAAKQMMKELMRGSDVDSQSVAQNTAENSQRIDGQIVENSDEEAESDEDGDRKEIFDSAALSALLKAATGGGSEGGNVTITSSDGSRLFSVERPAGLGSSVRSLRPAPRPNRSNIFTPSDLTVSEENLSEEEKKKLEKIQLIRVKYLRLVQRLGHSADDSIAAQVLYRLVLAAGRNITEAFGPETAKKTAMQLESEGKDDLDFSLNILVLGKTGVGKSATINSIFGEEKTTINAFKPGTTTVQEILGSVGGVKIRVIDTPGLRSSVMDQAFNRKILSSVKKFTKKCPPDILLYVDRLDNQTRDLNDLPMLRSITSILGSSIWRSAVVTLTHGASAPPDGPSGNPLSYEVFVAQRSHVVQQSIGQAVGDLRMMNPSLMNPVTLVENHPSCRKNREGQSILPNGQSWRPQLLLLCYSLKILAEVNSLTKPQDPFDHRKLFGFRVRSPPLPYLLSTLLQSRTHPKLPTDQGETVDSDIELDDLSDSDQEDEEDEYDQLPPFKPLKKAQLAKLSKEQRKAYFDEYDYRVKLLQKKQWKEELKRMKEMKKGKNRAGDYGEMGQEADPEDGAASPVPVPLPDMVLPPSFDGDNPAYRYRFLEPTSQLLARPVLDTHGWDHDCGYDGVSLEENLAIADKFPAGVAVQITKDKKEFNIHLDSSVAAKHGENESTMAGFDIQTIGKNLAYIVRGETKFKKLKRNKMAAGMSVTFLGENVATGLKFEDQVSIGKRITLVGSTGTVRSQGDAAYGANLEARLKDKDFPIGQDQSTLGLSLMRWRGDLALGANLQSLFSIGRSSKVSVRVGLNNKLSGQITVKTSSSEQLQLALVAVLPIAMSIYRSIWPESGESYSAY